MNPFHVLVIGYGNPLRGDDGLALRAVSALKHKFPSTEVEIIEAHQLVPEMADTIRQSDAVIFVDAAAAEPGRSQAGQICIVPVGDHDSGNNSSSPFHHQYSPLSLVALTRQLYGARPRSYIATLVGQDFSPGELLSPEIQRALPDFICEIEKRIRNLIAQHSR